MEKNEKTLLDKLALIKTEAYIVWGSNNDKGGDQFVHGVYGDNSTALLASKKISYFGSDGWVTKATNVYNDVNDNLFELKPIGKFTDVEIEYNKRMKERILAKLTKDELAFIAENKI